MIKGICADFLCFHFYIHTLPYTQPSPFCNIAEQDRCPALRQRIIDEGVSTANELDTDGSAQNKAYNWVCAEEFVCPTDPYCMVVQRYIMSVFYFSTNGDMWNNCSANGEDCDPLNDRIQPSFNPRATRWLEPYGNECEWFGIKCHKNGCLAILQLGKLMNPYHAGS